jgi:hypothetical protein
MKQTENLVFKKSNLKIFSTTKITTYQGIIVKKVHLEYYIIYQYNIFI